MATRYPKKLELLKHGEKYSASRIAAICMVSERTVYRWYSEGLIERDEEFGAVTFTVNEMAVPVSSRISVRVPRKYTDDELEEMVLLAIKGEKEIGINVTELIQKKIDTRTWGAVLTGLDEIRELVEYMTRR